MVSYAPRSISLLCQLLHDIRLERLRLASTRPPLLDLAILANQELLKVPLDTLQAHQSRLLRLQPLKHGVRTVAVDVDLAEHGKGHAVVDLAEGLDLVVGARVLVVELVAREAEDLKVGVFGLDLLVEFLEALELNSEAALGGGVDD